MLLFGSRIIILIALFVITAFFKFSTPRYINFVIKNIYPNKPQSVNVLLRNTENTRNR